MLKGPFLVRMAIVFGILPWNSGRLSWNIAISKPSPQYAEKTKKIGAINCDITVDITTLNNGFAGEVLQSTETGGD